MTEDEKLVLGADFEREAAQAILERAEDFDWCNVGPYEAEQFALHIVRRLKRPE